MEHEWMWLSEIQTDFELSNPEKFQSKFWFFHSNVPKKDHCSFVNYLPQRACQGSATNSIRKADAIELPGLASVTKRIESSEETWINSASAEFEMFLREYRKCSTVKYSINLCHLSSLRKQIFIEDELEESEPQLHGWIKAFEEF